MHALDVLSVPIQRPGEFLGVSQGTMPWLGVLAVVVLLQLDPPDVDLVAVSKVAPTLDLLRETGELS